MYCETVQLLLSNDTDKLSDLTDLTDLEKQLVQFFSG